MNIKFLVSILLCSVIYAKITPVAINNSGAPAIDLVHPEWGVLVPDLASELQLMGEDLSLLEPETNDIYSGIDTSSDSMNQSTAFSLQSIDYVNSLKSPEGVMRFVTKSEESIFEVTLSKNLHTMLLRKSLFRKLGYKIPQSKWYKEIKINFQTEAQKNFFKKIQIFSETSAAASRWVKSEGPLHLVLKDILIKSRNNGSETDISLNMFPTTLERRSLRSTSLVYAYTNLNESINAFSRNLIRKYDGNYLLDHDQDATFQTSMDDLKWIARKIARLSKNDIVESVKESSFPAIIEKILINKLIDRRNQLVNLLNLVGDDIKSKLEKEVIDFEGYEDGFLENIEFPDYATKFTFPEMEGPFDDLFNYALAVSQETLIQTAVLELNEKLQAFSLAEARTEWLVNDFNENKDYALEYFQQFGQFPALPFAKWVTPTFGGGLILGRDLVVGSRLGTDNLVQLADSFGYSFNLGLHVGLERVFKQDYSGSFAANFRYMISYSHIQPVEKIRDYLGADYKNMLVGLYKKSIQKRLHAMGDTEDLEEDEAREIIKDARDYIDENFAIGESMIISENVTPDILGSLQIPLFNSFSASITSGLRVKELKRIHLYRKSQNEYQLYYDDANLKEVFARARMNYVVPFANFNTAKQSGKYNMKFFTFNLDPNTRFNKEFYSDTLSLVKILETRSLEGVDKKPVEIDSYIMDKVSESNILLFVNKSLRKLSDIEIKFHNNDNLENASFISSTYGSQSGVNVKEFLKRLGNYLLKEFAEDFDYSFSLNPFEEPSRTFFGRAKTIETEFQAKVDSVNNEFEDYQNLYIVTRLSDEGSGVSLKKLWKKLQEVNTRTGLQIFNYNHAVDAGRLRLFNVETKIHLYDRAVKKILSLSKEEILKLGIESKKISNRNLSCGNSSTIAKKLLCGDFSHIARVKKNCLSSFEKSKLSKGKQCIAKYGYYITKFIPIKLLIETVGERNIFVESAINGFRVGKETLYRPVIGNSFGRRNAKFINGPINSVVSFLNIIKSELAGSWFRKRL